MSNVTQFLPQAVFRTVLSTLFLFISLALITISAQAAEQKTPESFAKYIEQYKSPTLVFDNKQALQLRLRLLDQLPPGGKANVLTFVFENGWTTRLLAAHMCRAAQRGVGVKFIADSKYGSVPGKFNLFDYPVTEEVYQFMANCGQAAAQILGDDETPSQLQVRIHNHFPILVTDYTAQLPQNRFENLLAQLPEKIRRTVPGKINDLFRQLENESQRQRLVELLEVAAKPQSPLMRLNHRKLFWVEAPRPDGQGVHRCVLMGGRNLGDHYLSWHSEGDSFMDADVFVCDTHLKDAESEDVFNQALTSFNEVWDDTSWTLDPTKYLVNVLNLEADPNFQFKYIYPEVLGGSYMLPYQDSGTDESAVSFQWNDFELSLFKNLDLKNEFIWQSGAMYPPQEDNTSIVEGFGLPLSYNWRFLRAHWQPTDKFVADDIRKKLWDMVDREQSEIFIESAYMEFDLTLREKLQRAMEERNVRVLVISNSVYTSDGGSRLIPFTRAPWVYDMNSRFGRDGMDFTLGDRSERRFNGLYREYVGTETDELFQLFVTTPYAGHMIHFKGASFKCQKQDDTSFRKTSILTSHNFHPRSGLSDKEHALIWDEPIDLSCVRAVAPFLEDICDQGSEANTVVGNCDALAEIRSRHKEVSPGLYSVFLKEKYRDLYELRLDYWTELDSYFKNEFNTPVLLSFKSLFDELNVPLPSRSEDVGRFGIEVDPDQKLSQNEWIQEKYRWLSQRVLYSQEPEAGKVPELTSEANLMLKMTHPGFRWVADFL